MDNERKRQLVKKISDETITIREFMEAAEQPGHKKIKAAVKAVKGNLSNAGVDLDMPWKSFASDDKITELFALPDTVPGGKKKIISAKTFQNIQEIERENTIFYRSNKKLVNDARRYAFTLANDLQISGTGGIANRVDPVSSRQSGFAKKSRQLRGSLKLYKVPKAEISIPKIVEATSKIKDLNARRAVAFNVLVPFRPGEVAGLKLSDVDLETGFIKAWTRGNKTRPSLMIEDVALEILRDAAEDAKREGREEIFNTTTAKMTKGIKQSGGLKDLFEVHLATLGRSIKGSSDIRKLIPSLLVHQLGAEGRVVSAIMGHDKGELILADLARETARHYASPIDEGTESLESRGLRTLQIMIAKSLNLITLNELPDEFQVPAVNLTREGAESLVVPEITIGSVERVVELTPEQEAAKKATEKLRLAKLEKVTAQSELDALDIREQIASKKPEVISAEEAAKKLADENKAWQEYLEGGESSTTPEADAPKQPPKPNLRLKSPIDIEKGTSGSEALKQLIKKLKGQAPGLIIGAVVGGGTLLAAKTAEAAIDVALEPTDIGTPLEERTTKELREALAITKGSPEEDWLHPTWGGSAFPSGQQRRNIEREQKDRERLARHKAAKKISRETGARYHSLVRSKPLSSEGFMKLQKSRTKEAFADIDKQFATPDDQDQDQQQQQQRNNRQNSFLDF